MYSQCEVIAVSLYIKVEVIGINAKLRFFFSANERSEGEEEEGKGEREREIGSEALAETEKLHTPQPGIEPKSRSLSLVRCLFEELADQQADCLCVYCEAVSDCYTQGWKERGRGSGKGKEKEKGKWKAKREICLTINTPICSHTGDKTSAVVDFHGDMGRLEQWARTKESPKKIFNKDYLSKSFLSPSFSLYIKVVSVQTYCKVEIFREWLILYYL